MKWNINVANEKPRALVKLCESFSEVDEGFFFSSNQLCVEKKFNTKIFLLHRIAAVNIFLQHIYLEKISESDEWKTRSR